METFSNKSTEEESSFCFVFFSVIYKHEKHAVLAYSWFKVRLLFLVFIKIDLIFFSYIQYSALCARTLRRCLKSSSVKEAMKREESFVRVSKWQAGKISDQVYPASEFIDGIFRFLIKWICFIFRSGTNSVELILLMMNRNFSSIDQRSFLPPWIVSHICVF